MPTDQLTMTFDPNTIEHLGVRMYTTLPPVLAELISNSYDADASVVKLTLIDEGAEKTITVEDDGTGMSFEDIKQRFLHIGRNRRTEELTSVTPGGRSVIGKKGLGKLSFFGVAHGVRVETKKGSKLNVFTMDWDEIKRTTREYHPTLIQKDVNCPPGEHGTKITLTRIQRVTGFDPESIANSLSKIFIVDPGFEIIIQHNSGEPVKVDNNRKFAELDREIEWRIPADLGLASLYEKKVQVTGRLMTAKTPISPKTNLRGIALFAKKKLVNLPEYFSDSTSSHFFSYLTGWLEVDFIDDLPEDVIATNRQSINWDHPETAALRSYLQALIRWLAQDWRAKRSQIREKEISDLTGINVPDWFSKLPRDVRSHVEPIVLSLIRDSELPSEVNRRAVSELHQIVPEYPNYHWRHLHSEVKSASESDYQRADYYRAFLEAVKRYISAVKAKSDSTNSSDFSMMGEVFGSPRKLQVAHHFKKTNGDDFQPSTLANIEDGQKYLSMGVLTGCRNPVSHEEIQDLRESRLFTEKDCLDALSLLSHLFTRLENAVRV